MANQHLKAYKPRSPKDITVPFLQALLHHAPTEQGRANIACDIASCVDDDAIHQLYERYLNCLIIPMRAQGGTIPQVSNHPSRPTADLDQYTIEQIIELAKRDQKVLKDLSTVDYESLKSKKITLLSNEENDITIAAHIIPFSIAAKDTTPAAIQKSSAIFEILQTFGGIHVHELNGHNINRVENVLTLVTKSHVVFGRLDICLEPVKGRTNIYRLRKFIDFSTKVPNGTIIDLSSSDPEIPSPDSRYLALHAACAHVYHLSGAAEVIDTILKDLEDTKVLATDGSSMHILHDALSMVSVSSDMDELGASA